MKAKKLNKEQEAVMKHILETYNTDISFTTQLIVKSILIDRMDSIEAVISSGLGHLTSFKGSDSLPTIYGARKFYDEDGFVCGSVNATEHSVACSHMEISNNETVEYLVEVTYDENGNFIKEEKIN